MKEIFLSALRSSIIELAERKDRVSEALEHAIENLKFELPPQREMGDWACPLFPLAKPFRSSPALLAEELQPLLTQKGLTVKAVNGYLNFFSAPEQEFPHWLNRIAAEGSSYGHGRDRQNIAIEFSSPNTNKPLHLGHLRNNILGESLSRILRARGAEVRKLNLINDRGIHICKSMLAYQRFGNNETPETRGLKGDFFVGEYYVRFEQWRREQPEDNPEALAQQMLHRWEQGDPEIRKLWETMRAWVLDGIRQTYRRTQITFDRFDYESATYQLGQDLVEDGLKRGIFTRREDGAVIADLSDYQLDEKVLRRGDGTAIYITQDLGTAVSRHEELQFDQLIYVVGAEQNYHFTVLFRILGLLGYQWAEQLYHLSYGMVLLPNGKMKSREGTVVDADTLLDELETLALQEIKARDRETLLDEPEQTASSVALGALHYYLLQFNPQREITFLPEESLSFQGNSGPYLQYVCARIYSLLRKAGEKIPPDPGELQAYRPEDWKQLGGESEWELLKQLSRYPEAVLQAARELSPAQVVKSLNETARGFSRFYHDVPILQDQDPERRKLRLALCKATLRVLRNGMDLLVIPVLEKM